MTRWRSRGGDYPDNWEEIARAVKDRAGWRCERCGSPSIPGYILTVHHMDGNPANCAASNLVALCQKCHLHIQGKYRPGQLFLPGLEEEWAKRPEANDGQIL